MKNLNNELMDNRTQRPIKFVQFGEGNFLRAFTDWMIQELNDGGFIEGNVAVVQPTPHGRVSELAKQDGLYTLITEGVQNGEFHSSARIIDVISQFNDPFKDYDGFLDLAGNPDLEFVISNTTEAGIVLDEADNIHATPPQSFPGKVLAFLMQRYEVFKGSREKGLYFLPCELIDNNGDELHRCVKRLAQINGLDEAFLTWLDEANTFTNTLVDRIVPGYPKARAEEFGKQLGYEDNSLVLGEVFHLWVIENRKGIADRLAGHKAGLNMVFADDITPYKIRKVRILNGLHTLMVPVSYLKGLDTVGETMNDDLMRRFLNETVEKEIIPGTEGYLPANELRLFANEVYDRFNNPKVRHELMSIALNATSKFKSRLLPTALDYVEAMGEFPSRTAFSLASNLVLFRGKRGTEAITLQDDQRFLDFYQDIWSQYEKGNYAIEDVVSAYLGLVSHWEMDLNDLPRLNERVTASVKDILEHGMERAIQSLLESSC